MTNENIELERLEPWHERSYLLNQVRAVLMYFPVFYGRIIIQKLTEKNSPKNVAN